MGATERRGPRAVPSAVLLGAVLLGCAELGPGPVAWDGLTVRRAPADVVRLQWRQPLMSAMDLESRPRFRARPSWDAEHGVVLVGGGDQSLHALRAHDGMELWRFVTLGAVEGTPVVDHGVVFFGSDDGALYAADARTGRSLWRAATAAEVVRPPIVTQSAVYFVNGDDTVMAVDRVRGEVRWRYRREQPGGITASGHAGLVLVDQRIVTGFSDGSIVALNATDGSVEWERDTTADVENVDSAREAHRLLDVDTTPVVLGDTLYVASATAGLYALDRRSGSVRWRAEGLLGVTALASDGRDLFATSTIRGLLKVDASDGSVLWSRAMPSAGLIEPLVERGYLWVPSTEGSLWVLDPTDGSPVVGLGRDGLGSTPLIVDDRLYYVSSASVAYAYGFRALRR